MKIYFRRDNQAQSSIEFSVALVAAVLFLILGCNLFVWLNRNMVQRQREYENTRAIAGDGNKNEPGKLDFYVTQEPNRNPNYKPLNVFISGGYEK